MKRILIVEDDALLAMDLQMALEEGGYEVVEHVVSGSEALEAAHTLQPNLVLMDIHLDGQMDGIMAASLIRKECQIPVIYLTAHSDDATLERAQESLPYGYLVKPFVERELYSMIKVALFKHQSELEAQKSLKQEMSKIVKVESSSDTLIPLGENYLFYKKEGELKKANQSIKLTKKERAFLQIMTQNIGHVVSFEEIEHYIWEEDVPASGTLRSLVRRVREKIDEPIIENVTGYGYKLLG